MGDSTNLVYLMIQRLVLDVNYNTIKSLKINRALSYEVNRVNLKPTIRKRETDFQHKSYSGSSSHGDAKIMLNLCKVTISVTFLCVHIFSITQLKLYFLLLLFTCNFKISKTLPLFKFSINGMKGNQKYWFPLHDPHNFWRTFFYNFNFFSIFSNFCSFPLFQNQPEVFQPKYANWHEI